MYEIFMDHFRSREELEAFVASLDLPEDRREIIAAELLAHVELRENLAILQHPAETAEQIALTSLGSRETLRRNFQRVARLFTLDRRAALGLGARMGATYLIGWLVGHLIVVKVIGGFLWWSFFRHDWTGWISWHTPYYAWWIVDFAVYLLSVCVAFKLAWPAGIFTRLRRDPWSAPALIFFGIVTTAAALPLEIISWSWSFGDSVIPVLSLSLLWAGVTTFWIGGALLGPRIRLRTHHEAE